ncbi:MAG: polysaccharide biosynthesis tyrosine autokinase [Lachnospiraceae bacterium]|nr:polysaccharide biosynthesis tyrosine autokinase [Lachnospiraceae bacterium]
MSTEERTSGKMPLQSELKKGQVERDSDRMPLQSEKASENNLEHLHEDDGKIDLFRIMGDMAKGIRAVWWILLIAALAAAVWSYATANRSYTPFYQTSGTVYVNMASGENGSYQNVLSAEQMATVFPYLLNNGVLSDAIEKEMKVDAVPGTISVTVSPNTNLLTFVTEGSDPKEVHQLLEAVIKVFPDTLNYIVGPTEFTLFKDMGIPSEPYNEKPSQLLFIKDAVKSAVKVFLLGVILAALYGLSIRTISNREEIKQYLNAANLGSLPSVQFKKRSNSQKNQLTIDNSQVPYGFGESLRVIRTRFERQAESDNCRTVLVTSTIPGEGKTTVAVNLALSLAQKGKKVLFIDGDMRNPSAAGILQLDSSQQGLSELLSGKAELKDVITSLPESGLFVLPAGKATSRSTDLISSEAMSRLLKQVYGYAEYIIIDTPPVLLLGDSMAIGKYADGCIYVVRREQARRHLVMNGFAQIAESGCHMLGTILNDDQGGSIGYGGRYGRYGKYGKYGAYGKYAGYGKYGQYSRYGK